MPDLCKGIPKRELLLRQHQGAQRLRPQITCECGFVLPLRHTYKCLDCGLWFCRQCAEIHFGRRAAS